MNTARAPDPSELEEKKRHPRFHVGHLDRGMPSGDQRKNVKRSTKKSVGVLD